MDAIILIKILLFVLGSAYISALLLAWRYESRKTNMYRMVLKRIEILKSLGLSMAVIHAKTFKIEEDYRKWIEMIENRQQFIFEKVLFLKRSTLKTKYKGSYNFQI